MITQIVFYLSNLRDHFFLKSKRKFLHGTGIEIGALHKPLNLRGLKIEKITYVDRMTNEALRQQYPELNQFPLVQVDLVSDGSVLEAIPDNSLDFIIANHLIEHLENPILALKNWNSKLKPQGVLYMAVPDKRFTFDIDRPCTTNQHLHEDFQSSKNELAKRNLDHYRTTAVTIEKRIGQDADERVRDLIARNYSIHFHAWDSDCFRSFIDFVITEIQVPYAILDYNRANRILKECIVILGKQ